VPEHALWSPGRFTVRTVRDRRAGHTVDVRVEGVPVAEGDDEGLLRAPSGLVLAEAVLVPRTEDDPPVLTVDVFGVRQGEVRVGPASSSWRGSSLEADLLVDGATVALLQTCGRRAEEAIVVADGAELVRLDRFDHLRGTRGTVSSWDLTVDEIPDERLRAVAVTAILRLPKLQAVGAEDARRRQGRRHERHGRRVEA
jgi:hypothetical protein